jgi:hypothetical protein
MTCSIVVQLFIVLLPSNSCFFHSPYFVSYNACICSLCDIDHPLFYPQADRTAFLNFSVVNISLHLCLVISSGDLIFIRPLYTQKRLNKPYLFRAPSKVSPSCHGGGACATL